MRVAAGALMVLALALTSASAGSSETGPLQEALVVQVEEPLAQEAPSLAELPGVLLLASTRDNGALTERIDRYRLYTVSGGEVQPLSFPEEELGSISAVLSADGGRALVNAGGRALYLLDLTSGSAVPTAERLPPLSFVQTDIYLSVAWSPDESWILVVRPHPVGMYRLAVDETSAPLPYVGTRPGISPDGQRIVFARLVEDLPVATLHVAPADGSADETKVTPDEIYELAPVWMPDGSGIAYLAAGETWQVRLWDFASEASYVLAEAPEDYALDDLAVSPDGAWVAYTIQNWRTLNRWVRITSVADPQVSIDVPQDQTWSDRVLGWVSGPEAAPAESGGGQALIPALNDPGWAWDTGAPGWMVLLESDYADENNWYLGGLDNFYAETGWV